ncbi:anthranilate synthase component I [Falsirhodobacter sp. alg1]|uniref:anthranilate synthase component I n=1 Tax=Falsirhodobacter sp. alg1 TaxID=1472418 RepID=UPI0005ED7082|nr:anthranilate synthase component I [Falsirhodobacter sp. alg1]
MNLHPSYETFEKLWAEGRNQVVYARLAADLDTPVSLMMKLTETRADTFLLESVTGGEVRGRYSVIGMKPDLIWRCEGDQVAINREARLDRDAFRPDPAPPLESLRALIAESRIDMPAELPPIASGLYGYLGYDMIRLVEHLPNINPDTIGAPDAVLLRPSVVAVLDGVKGEVTVVAPAWASSGLSARAAYAQAAERVSDALRDLDRTPATHALGSVQPAPEVTSNFTPQGFRDAVDAAKNYIRAGDIFQVVPSQRFSQPFTLPPFSLYRSLRRTNPSPFMFFFNHGNFQIIGASPEILVRLRDGEVTIRPVAGTRKRGATPAEDQALADDLLADPKELAEHLMLLDLGRNDVGRVAKIGTVRPTEQFIIERYSHVMHIVSNVVGELADGEDALSALLAGLPAGTVSGAPKVRAMEIIDELEPNKRGVYGGGVGYFAANGEMDFCIALRTAVLKDEVLHIQSGAGIVYDSDPESEFQETVNKAMALQRAAEDAGLFSGRGNS